MSRFYSETNRPARVIQPATRTTEPEYKETIDTKTGKKVLKKIGEIDVYEKIQTATEGTSLKELINRYNIDPSESAVKLETETGEILDYTNQPRNLMEALEITNQAKNLFENSSKEIKQKFNNNFTEFLAAANNGKLETALKEFKPKKETTAEILENQISIDEIKKDEPVTKTTTGVTYE